MMSFLLVAFCIRRRRRRWRTGFFSSVAVFLLSMLLLLLLLLSFAVEPVSPAQVQQTGERDDKTRPRLGHVSVLG